MKPILYCILSGLIAFYPRPSASPRRTLPRPEFSTSHNRFAFRLFNTILGQDTAHDNKLIAPFSLYTGLGMLSNGAAKSTRDTLTAALGDLEIPNLNSYCKEALQQMPLADKTVQLQIANGLWFNQKKMTLTPTYESITGNFYYSQAQPLSFGARDAATHINQWLDQNTSHMLPPAIDHSSLTESMYLLNAFCFKGSWKSPFKTSSYNNFHVTPNIPKAVKFMSRTSVVSTFSDTAFTMVELPCGEGNAYSLLALLPEDDLRGPKSLAASLTPERLDEAMSRMTAQYISLYLPSWECTYSISDLRPALSQLGMGIAFNTNGEADFSNMYSNGAKKAWLSQTRHATCIRINENGIESSPAGNAGDISTGPAGLSPRHQPRTVAFDRPFLYLLMEKQHNLVLQVGIVSDPTTPETAKPVSATPPKRPAIRLPRRKK